MSQSWFLWEWLPLKPKSAKWAYQSWLTQLSPGWHGRRMQRWCASGPCPQRVCNPGENNSENAECHWFAGIHSWWLLWDYRDEVPNLGYFIIKRAMKTGASTHLEDGGGLPLTSSKCGQRPTEIRHLPKKRWHRLPQTSGIFIFVWHYIHSSMRQWGWPESWLTFH